jgi:hypothetical protein
VLNGRCLMSDVACAAEKTEVVKNFRFLVKQRKSDIITSDIRHNPLSLLPKLFLNFKPRC